MPASIDILLDRFQLFRVPSLPSLVYSELTSITQQQHLPSALSSLLEQDVFLFAKALGSFRQESVASPFSADEMLLYLGSERVEALISQSAMQTTHLKTSPLRKSFYKMYWRQSLLAREVASKLAFTLSYENIERAEFAAQFLNLGELVLEDLFAEEYIRLHERVKTEARQVKEERLRLGFSHAEIGSELLSRWGLDSFICDSLRYHQESIEQILDASKLVKISWLVNLMSTSDVMNDSIVEAGDRLFGLKEAQLDVIHKGALSKIDEVARELNISFSSASRIPLCSESTDAIVNSDKSVLVALNEQVRNINLFNAVRSNFFKSTNTADQAKLGKVLGETLNILFGFHECIIFSLAGKEKNLSVCLSSLADARVKELKIRCTEGRSVIVSSFLSGQESVNTNSGSDLTVVDRQILSLLGKSAMVCDPIMIDGEVEAVLVMGIQESKAAEYCKQGRIRNLLKSELIESLGSFAKEGSSALKLFGKRAVDSDYERRISDTIHEVNNPLSTIKNYLQLLSIKQKNDPALIEEVNIIKSEIDRVSNLLANLKNNASVINEESDEVDVNLVIENLSKVFSASMVSVYPIEFDLDLALDLPLISFKESAFKQILTNLVKNAVEAIEGANKTGHISIKTYANIYLNGRHYIQVKVTDDGPGISVEAMNSLFVAGHTTKGNGHSGSGLAIVKSLIESMGGQISCCSDEKETSFSMLFLRKMQFQKRSRDRRTEYRALTNTQG